MEKNKTASALKVELNPFDVFEYNQRMREQFEFEGEKNGWYYFADGTREPINLN